MPRKTNAGEQAVAGAGGASMRPRPDAAENSGSPASPAPQGTRFNEAAARCRGKRPHDSIDDRLREVASMRPRPDAAENCNMRARAAG